MRAQIPPVSHRPRLPDYQAGDKYRSESDLGTAHRAYSKRLHHPERMASRHPVYPHPKVFPLSYRHVLSSRLLETPHESPLAVLVVYQE